jgi:hypothetical protein
VPAALQDVATPPTQALPGGHSDGVVPLAQL